MTYNGVTVEHDEIVEIDEKEIKSNFTEEDGFQISDNYRVVTVKSNNASGEKPVTLTKDQVQVLIDNGLTFVVVEEGVTVSFPKDTFVKAEEDVEIIINEVNDISKSVGKAYKFTLNQGNNNVTKLPKRTTLSFKVDMDKITNTDDLRVFYFNEEKNTWINEGGIYEDGIVRTTVDHFSVFAVFESDAEELLADGTPIEKDETEENNGEGENSGENGSSTEEDDETKGSSTGDGEEENGDKDQEQESPQKKNEEDDEQSPELIVKENENSKKEGNELPNTSTPTYNVLLIGLVLIVVGVVLSVLRRKRKYTL